MELLLTRTFQKNFRKLPKGVHEKVENALREIYLDPHKGKKLSGELEGEFSYRVGRYRIIYCMDERKNIWVETVRDRKDIYRKK